MGGHASFEEMLTKGAAAQKALIDADADRRVRRALGTKYKGPNSEYQMGQQVWRQTTGPGEDPLAWTRPRGHERVQKRRN